MKLKKQLYWFCTQKQVVLESFGEFWRVTRNGRGASNSPKPLILNGEPCRIRTYDPLIKRTPKKLNNT